MDVPAIPPGHVDPPELSPEIEELGKDVPLTLNWVALAEALNCRPDVHGSEQREHLFKEFVARCEAETAPSATKRRQLQLKGVLSQKVLTRELRTMLRKRGAVTSGFAKLDFCIEQAFDVARRGEDPVTSVGMSFLDMNQFHSLILHLGHYLDLRWYFASVAAEPELADPAFMLEDYAVQQDEFKCTLRLLTCPVASNHPSTAWSRVGEFERWAEDPTQTFEGLQAEAELRRGLGALSFGELADECLRHVHETLPPSMLAHSAGFGLDSRTRAYHLLQVLNNTPSLPNSVPGPFPPSPRRRASPSITGGFVGLEAEGEERWRQGQPPEAPHFPRLTPRRRGESSRGVRGPPVNIYAIPSVSSGNAPSFALGAVPLRPAGLHTPRLQAVAPMA